MKNVLARSVFMMALTCICYEARADYISVVGDDAKYGRVTADFSYLDYGGGFLQPEGANFSPLGLSFYDDGTGVGNYTSNSYTLSTFYEQPGSYLSASADVSLPSSHVFQSGEIYGIGSGLTGTVFGSFHSDNGSDVFISFKALAVGINTVASVPLPASAPMFGTALLGLAGLGFAATYKKSAAAA